MDAKCFLQNVLDLLVNHDVVVSCISLRDDHIGEIPLEVAACQVAWDERVFPQFGNSFGNESSPLRSVLARCLHSFYNLLVFFGRHCAVVLVRLAQPIGTNLHAKISGTAVCGKETAAVIRLSIFQEMVATSEGR